MNERIKNFKEGLETMVRLINDYENTQDKEELNQLSILFETQSEELTEYLIKEESE